MSTPGAVRAGKNISDRFRRALPGLPESNAETLAEIIDAETAAPELLKACNHAVSTLKSYQRVLAAGGNKPFSIPDFVIQFVEDAIAKAEGRK